MQCFVGAVSIFQPGSLSKSINSRKAHHRRPRGVRPGSVRMQSIRTDGLESYSAGVSTLEGEGAYAVMAAASALEASSGQRVIHLEIGQPGFATPSNIAAAGSAAIDAGQTKYSAPAGTGELREAIASYVSQRGTVPATPAEIVVGPGAKPGLFFATLALVRGAQDQVIIPDPGFPTYKAMVAVAGGTPVPVPLRKDLAGPDIAALRRAVGTRTRLVVLNSPANPTGGVCALFPSLFLYLRAASNVANSWACFR